MAFRKISLVAVILAPIMLSFASAQEIASHGSALRTISLFETLQAQLNQGREQFDVRSQALQDDSSRALLQKQSARINAALGAPSIPPELFVNVVSSLGTTPTREQNAAMALAIGNNEMSQSEANPEVPAGFTFLGQFLDHDITFNEGRTIQELIETAVEIASLDPTVATTIVTERLRNSRTALLDLDSVYGLGITDFSVFFDKVAARSNCELLTEPEPGCFRPALLSEAEKRVMPIYQKDNTGRLTGHFNISYRTASTNGPVIADLPRCADSSEFMASPICQPQCTALGCQTPSQIVHRAVIGDPRNDENVIIAQLHLIFLLAHNKVFDKLVEDANLDPQSMTSQQFSDTMRKARELIVLHWQSLVLDDYLVKSVGEDLTAALKTEPFTFYTKDPAVGAPYCKAQPGAMPHEFAVGAFRFGHSQVRNGYSLNQIGRAPGERPNGAGFGGLFGGKPLSVETAVDFRFFFEGVDQVPPHEGDVDGPTPSLAIDTVLSDALSRLIAPSIPQSNVDVPTLSSLAARNLARAGSDTIPGPGGDSGIDPIAVASGFATAEFLVGRGANIETLTDEDVRSLKFAQESPIGAAFQNGLSVTDLPLWVYILAEAELLDGDASGTRLDGAGALIVGETIAGLIHCYPNGVLAPNVTFEPNLFSSTGALEPGSYLTADFINFALE